MHCRTLYKASKSPQLNNWTYFKKNVPYLYDPAYEITLLQNFVFRKMYVLKMYIHNYKLTVHFQMMNSGICILCYGKYGILHSSRKCGHFLKYMHFIGSVMLRNIASSNFSSLFSTIVTLSSSASEGFFKENESFSR